MAPVPIACNVKEAVDTFSSDSFLSLSTRLEPGPIRRRSKCSMMAAPKEKAAPRLPAPAAPVAIVAATTGTHRLPGQ